VWWADGKCEGVKRLEGGGQGNVKGVRAGKDV